MRILDFLQKNNPSLVTGNITKSNLPIQYMDVIRK